MADDFRSLESEARHFVRRLAMLSLDTSGPKTTNWELVEEIKTLGVPPPARPPRASDKMTPEDERINIRWAFDRIGKRAQRILICRFARPAKSGGSASWESIAYAVNGEYGEVRDTYRWAVTLFVGELRRRGLTPPWERGEYEAA